MLGSAARPDAALLIPRLETVGFPLPADLLNQFLEQYER